VVRLEAGVASEVDVAEAVTPLELARSKNERVLFLVETFK
jgi:hypothetical protein